MQVSSQTDNAESYSLDLVRAMLSVDDIPENKLEDGKREISIQTLTQLCKQQDSCRKSIESSPDNVVGLHGGLL